jgi:hypothetical protein
VLRRKMPVCSLQKRKRDPHVAQTQLLLKTIHIKYCYISHLLRFAGAGAGAGAAVSTPVTALRGCVAFEARTNPDTRVLAVGAVSLSNRLFRLAPLLSPSPAPVPIWTVGCAESAN